MLKVLDGFGWFLEYFKTSLLRQRSPRISSQLDLKPTGRQDAAKSWRRVSSLGVVIGNKIPQMVPPKVLSIPSTYLVEWY